MSNDYSERWYRTFLENYPPDRTDAEIELVSRWLPLPDFRTVLDLCCGWGRHAAILASRGYAVTGLDINEAALREARGGSGGAVNYVLGDMRQLDGLPTTFDAVMIMWASFGNFDAATNETILAQIHGRLRAGGRFVLDIYDPRFFENHLGEREQKVDGRVVAIETKRLNGKRLTVHLEYGQGGSDTFEWQLYSPEELESLAGRVGFSVLHACSNFEQGRQPAGEFPRMQFLLQRDA